MFVNSLVKKSIFLILVFTISHVTGQFEGDSCIRKYDNSPGTCRNVRSCPRVREEYKQGVPLTICAYLSGQPVICCPDSNAVQTPSWIQPPATNLGESNNETGNQKRICQRKCDEYGELTKEKVFVNPLALGSSSQQALSYSTCDSTTPLIVGGEKTKNGEYPHMAAIGWRSIDGTLSFKCGGSLISERFVLTAAHCGRADGQEPSIVRLGDQNIKSTLDGLIEVDVPIAEFIRHENYRRSSYYNDIALIKMTRNVQFSKTIRPACLWHKSNIPSPKTVATGWGYTEAAGQTSDELMKVELDIINNPQCNSYFEEGKLDQGIVSSQLCAGVLSGSKDTCNGDSGGPIQITMPGNGCLFYIVGITSFGSPFCGQKNSPGVYTRVSAYTEWIEDKVWQS